MTNYIEQIQAGIKKQQDLWTKYNEMKPTADMLPGERKKRLGKCYDIYQEILAVRYEVHQLHQAMQEERYRAVYNISPRQHSKSHAT